jgi:signal transduction histidine kinase
MSVGTFVPAFGGGLWRSRALPIDMAAGAIGGGRGAILELRCQAADAGDLETLLTVAAQELARREPREHPVRFRVVVEGQRRQLQYPVQADIHQIGRELLRNAFQHAQANQIEAEIRYRRSSLSLHVRDDGKGIDPEILGAGLDGHWVLAGIRERTNRIGGRLDIWTNKGAGTEVRLAVPASRAYAAAGSGRRSQSLLKLLDAFTWR